MDSFGDGIHQPRTTLPDELDNGFLKDVLAGLFRVYDSCVARRLPLGATVRSVVILIPLVSTLQRPTIMGRSL